MRKRKSEEKIRAQVVRGMHDRLPDEMYKMNKVIEIIKDIFEKNGYEPLETPALEYWSVLSGKKRYGEEEKLIYKFKDRGGRDVGLRYDFTVPLARVISANPTLPLPFRRYQVQPVWRGDSPQYGRFREFYQCDADIVGTKSMLAEAELINMIYEIFRALGFKEFKIKINNRKILSALCKYSEIDPDKEYQVYRAMDKVERIGIDGVAEKLELNEIPPSSCEKLIGILQECRSFSDFKKASIGEEGVEELKTLFKHLKEFGISKKFFTFDPWLARGLDYYTGPTFETVVREVKVGSLASGGRFDELIGIFKKKSIPAVGLSIGLDRLMIVLKELELLPLTTPVTKIIIAQYKESVTSYAIKIAQKLRKLGVATEIYPEFPRLSKQFSYANKKSIPYVIVVGPDEIKANQITIKDMRTGKQKKKSIEEIEEWVEKVK